MTTVGHYAIEELLGEGGIGQVHAARDTMLDREVAIKSLRPELANDRSFVDRFRVEANNLAKLAHPNITTLYSLLPEGGNLYMVMELVRGRTLEAIMKERGAPFAVPEAIAIISQAADGLGYAHAMGIVHRDIKPANMMITDTGLLKIMDFGIARAQGSQRMTRAGAAFGTPEYMSPEQVKGQEVDGRSDLYSLAIVLYEMLTGTAPFAANTDYELGQLHINTTPERPSRRISNIAPAIEKALMRALSKNPADRFESMAAFKAALGATASTSEAAGIVHKATRLMGAIPQALAASPALATVSSAVTESVDKTAIPFALKGIAIGAGAALVLAGGLVLLTWPSPPPAPVTNQNQTQASPVVQSTSNTTSGSTAQPCGMSTDGMFYRPCGPGQTPSITPPQTQNAASASKAGPPSGGAQKKPPFDGPLDPSGGRAGGPTGQEPGRVAPAQNPPPGGTGVASVDANVGSGAGAVPQTVTPQAESEGSGSTTSQPPSGGTADLGKPSESAAIAAYQQKNYALALELAEPLARANCIECQFIMARLYEMGAAGKKDTSIAADWYKKAAEAGLAKARANLGVMYLNGEGVIKDLRIAAEWFYKAAQQGHYGAAFNLALMFENGEGISKDSGQAIRWYTEAAKSDDVELANDARAAIENLGNPQPTRRRRRR